MFFLEKMIDDISCNYRAERTERQTLCDIHQTLNKVWKNLRSITFSSLQSTLGIILHQQQEHNVSWSYKCMTAVKHTHTSLKR